MPGTAAREQVDLLELVEGPDRPEHDDHGQDGAELRQRDVQEPAPRAGAVHLGRLVQLGRDRLQARQHADDHERGELPDVEQDRGDHRPRRVREPVDVATDDAGGLEARVHDAELGIEHPPPTSAMTTVGTM